ncbi:MAG TPA: DUF4040 domain-containing protein [Phycisphaerales bacterium]|nr:DUF4040 domain-containing protein [Phycisphaerales bacterium]HMP36686.1 DUF4040 domain-containing protein [Phycisphaerales bacterium]
MIPALERAVELAIGAMLVGLALWSVLVRPRFASIVGFVVFGLLLMLAWMRLGAPDVAMTEGAIGSGLAGFLLLSAAARLRCSEIRRARIGAGEPQRARDRSPRRSSIVALGVGCAAVAAALAAAVAALPHPAPSLAPAALERLPELGIGNPVSGVLIGFRALDTLVEKIVLVVALVGVWGLAAEASWRRAPSVDPSPEIEPIRFLARALPPVGIVLAIYLLWRGATEPGGAFPAGAILAAMAVLVLAAGLGRLPPTAARSLRLAICAGPLVFLGVGGLGMGVARGFLDYPAGFEVLSIKLIEVLLTGSVAVVLLLLVAGPPEEAASANGMRRPEPPL